jgi:predicted enzyme related to lactoylglutathione lyase
MSERDGYAPGVPCWVDTWQPDADAAMSFYTQLFGWEAEDTMPDDAEGTHYMCKLRGRDVAAIASRPEGAPEMRGRPGGAAEERPVSSWTTYVWVDDVDATAAKVRDAGGSVRVEPFGSLDGGRIAVIADPAGAALGIWSPGEHRGAELVNEPSAYAMSALVTNDPDGAKRFYNEVFGWGVETFEMGGDEMVMWLVDGYVGGEPQQPVRRDVVATMLPPGANGEGSPPRWNVDFWVADVDAAAAKVEELGGQVLTPPFDIPGAGMRQGAFRDPQGATFSLTQPPAGVR